MSRSLIALGANLGDRQAALDRAVVALAATPEVEVIGRSRWRETAPVGGPVGQDRFLNGAVLLETGLSPPRLLAVLQAIETRLGRQRGPRWGPRAIDLDLLLHGDEVIESDALRLPHPRMAVRRFVLEPAAEIAGEMVHPSSGWTVRQLLDHLESARPYFSLLGPPSSGKTVLAEALAQSLDIRFLADPAIGLPHGVPGDSPSQAFARHLQFLDDRAQVLDVSAWPANMTPSVSDFFFDQALAYAGIELTTPAAADFEQAWQLARAQVVRPKLLLAVDLDAASLARYDETPRDPVDEKLRRAMAALAARRGVGPVLHLRGDFQTRIQEASAAIAAMH